MKRTILALFATSICGAAFPQFVINEIMQSNIDCVYDDLHEFPDSWVELYNAGAAAASLSEWSIGLSNDPQTAWRLPSGSIPPGKYCLVYCDKAAQGMHTDFRLESGKGEVYLFHDSSEADHLSHKKMPAPNIAYGRVRDGGNEWGHQLEPTPGSANCGKVSGDILGAPLFSQAGGLMKQSFRLELSIPADAPEGTEIRYTVNGSEPIASSSKYTGPITISDSKVVRAKLFCDGCLSPISTTNSYIFHGRDVTLPVISIATKRMYFYDDEKGIYVEGKHGNFWHDWRRPINLEMFEPDGGEAVINQLCETRVKGGATRGEQLKSLAVYANKRFGTKRFEYEFFPEDMPGLTDWKSIELRNSGNDFHYTYMRDGAMQRAMGRHADIDWQPWQPAIVYLNGTYMGILNIRTRSNEDLIYTTNNGLDDIDVIENWGGVKEGNADEFERFRDFYTGKDHTLEEYEEWMDVDEFINYLALNLIMNNQDWPGNNLNMWREHGEEGRWRWIVKDTDFGLGLYGQQPEYRMLDWISDNSFDKDRNWGNVPDATRLFRRLMDIDEFKGRFIDRVCTYLGDFLRPQDVSDIIDGMKKTLDYEYPYHRGQINPWWPTWKDEVKWMKTWYDRRVPYFYRHMGEYYGLGSPITLIIKGEEGADTRLNLNDVTLSHDNFNGKWYFGRQLRLHGEVDGQPAGAWKVEVMDGSGTVQEFSGSDLTYSVPGCTALVITALRSGSGVDALAPDATVPSDDAWYDLSGRRIAPPTLPGLYIHKGEKKVLGVRY